MEDIFDAEITAEKKAELIKKCDEYFTAIRHILEKMAEDEEEIDRINGRTRAMLDQMRKAA